MAFRRIVEPGGKEEPVARGLALLLMSQGAFLVCGYVIHVFLARKLGPEDYGIFGFIIAVLTWVEILVYGSSNLAVKYIQTRPDRFQTWKSLFFRAQFVVAAGFFLPLAGLSLIVGWKSERYGFLFLIAFFDLLFIGFYQLYAGYLNGFRLYARQAITSVAYSISKAFSMVLLVYLGLRVRGALLGNIFSSMAGLLVGYLLFRSYGEALGGSSIPEEIRGERGISLSRVISESFLFALVPLMVNFILNLDTWVVNFARGGSEVGYYVSAGTLSRTIFFLFSATFMATFPAIVSSFRGGTTSERTKRLFGLTGDFFMAIALPSALLLAGNGRTLVRLFFGGEYLQAGPVTSILSLGMLFLTAFVFLVYVLYAAGKYAGAVRMLALPACLDIVSAPLMVLLWGIRGAALSTTMVSAAGLLMTYLSIRRHLALTWEWRRMTAMILLCCLCFLPPFLLREEGVLTLTLSGVAFFIYIILLVSTGLINRGDVSMAVKSLIPGRLDR